MTRTQRALAMVTQALRKLEPDQSRIKRKHARGREAQLPLKQRAA